MAVPEEPFEADAPVAPVVAAVVGAVEGEEVPVRDVVREEAPV